MGFFSMTWITKKKSVRLFTYPIEESKSTNTYSFGPFRRFWFYITIMGLNIFLQTDIVLLESHTFLSSRLEGSVLNTTCIILYGQVPWSLSLDGALPISNSIRLDLR